MTGRLVTGPPWPRAALRWGRGQLLYALAYLWRSLLWRTTFVGVTGSVGKSTTKECLAAVLALCGPTARTPHNQNDRLGVPRTLLRVRPWHRFAVVEVATERPGMLARSARLLRPDIAVVLAVARTHTNNFASLDDAAAEKACLVEVLSRQGVAVLNAEDPRVHAMAGRCRGHVRTFGRSLGADVWADEVYSRWPQRLSLRVHAGDRCQPVQTELVGEHWANAVLAVLCVAQAAGIPLATAAASLARVPPFAGRMQPVRLVSGATLIRDEENGSPDALEAALQLLRQTEATRRILVLSDVSDSRQKTRTRLRRLGQAAAGAADLVLFVGPHAHHGVAGALAAGMSPERVVGIAELPAAAAYLRALLRPGDVVLLKGRSTDHLSRIVFALQGTVGCWRTRCDRRILCDLCDQLEAQPTAG
ncbi:MAG: UDP-N-acetylmuramoyl-tripeptide--D-alanyl-D-alanine ligase [Candidatus Latescibacterota bacterium]